MTRARQLFFCLAVLMTALTAFAQPVFPSQPPSRIAKNDINQPPSPAMAAILPTSATATQQSPVAFFRRLLAMTPGERSNALTNRPPAVRARIMAKVQEYLALPLDERELRLRSTELRWYLAPLLQMSPTDRQARLAQMPEDMRILAQERLSRWDILPPDLKQEFLTNNSAVQYFGHVGIAGNATNTATQESVTVQFNQFFELTPAEKQQALHKLSRAERIQIEKTLETFDQLPAEQRQTCVRNYARFTGMSDDERADFLKNADRWSKMTPQERQTWRDLVEHVPAWPPPPEPVIDPRTAAITPPSANDGPRATMVTN